MQNLPMVRIVWVDSQSLCDRPWYPKDEAMDLRIGTCRSVGQVIYEDIETVTLALSESPDEFGLVKAIPKVAIIRRTVLAEVADS